PESKVLRAAAGGAVVLGAAVTSLVGAFRPVQTVPTPSVIAEELGRTPPGKTTVVDFVDFECPHCRYTHAQLLPVLEENKERIRLVRKHVPLRSHRHSEGLARAACCGETLGKGDAMADALMTTSDFTPENYEKVAASL